MIDSPPIPVLNDGFVRLVDVMGDDMAIVNAARISYQKGTKRKRSDEQLIRYLMRNRHTSPFEMCTIKLHIRMPMDAWRQMVRHRTASLNEYSTRYSEAIDSTQVTKPEEWRLQSGTNKQGSDGFIDVEKGEWLSMRERDLQWQSRQVYEARLARGVAREQARKDLPLSTYTEAFWQINLHNLLHFLRLRLDSHAQLEIRQYAIAIKRIVAEWVPWTWKAFENYQLHSLTLSVQELQLLRYILGPAGITNTLKQELEVFGIRAF